MEADAGAEALAVVAAVDEEAAVVAVVAEAAVETAAIGVAAVVATVAGRQIVKSRKLFSAGEIVSLPGFFISREHVQYRRLCRCRLERFDFFDAACRVAIAFDGE